MRRDVLRPGHDVERMFFPFDDHVDARHFGWYEGSKLLSVLSFLPQDREEAYSREAYRLRGMAVAPSYQGGGVGSRFLLEALSSLKGQFDEVRLVWCNARVKAAGFYGRLGFEKKSEGFDIPGIGMHFVYERKWF